MTDEEMKAVKALHKAQKKILQAQKKQRRAPELATLPLAIELATELPPELAAVDKPLVSDEKVRGTCRACGKSAKSTKALECDAPLCRSAIMCHGKQLQRQQLASKVASKVAPELEVVLEVAPKVAPEVEVVLEVAPKVAPELEAVLELAPKVAPELEVVLELAPKVAPEVEVVSGNFVTKQQYDRDMHWLVNQRKVDLAVTRAQMELLVAINQQTAKPQRKEPQKKEQPKRKEQPVTTDDDWKKSIEKRLKENDIILESHAKKLDTRPVAEIWDREPGKCAVITCGSTTKENGKQLRPNCNSCGPLCRLRVKNFDKQNKKKGGFSSAMFIDNEEESIIN